VLAQLAAQKLEEEDVDAEVIGINNRDLADFSVDIERTFDLDVVNNTTLAPGPDGLIDPSGASFINLTSLLTSRDNTRQGVADLITLARSLPTRRRRRKRSKREKNWAICYGPAGCRSDMRFPGAAC